ncbi:AI-2E family transporter [Butyricicoccus sp.]|uniref:AI-2E family transporter n=1 Tax=Butyricicoccus sp. TaxID=2049021 RepID=UPI003F15AB0E
MKESLKKYFGLGVTIVATGAVTLLIFFCIYKFAALTAAVKKLIGILMPVLVGIVIAYVLSPLYNWLWRKILRLLHHTLKWHGRGAIRCAGILAMTATFLGAGAVLAGLLALIIPQIIMSVSSFASTLPSNLMHVSQSLQKLLANNPEIEETAMSLYAQGVSYIEEWIQNSFTPSMQDAMGYISIGVMSTVSFVKNFFIGLIVAVYLLSGKENFLSQMTRCTYALFGARWGNVITEYARYANQVFTGFISGKLLDSLIIFLISVVVLNIMNMPYAMLVSVIIGVTNIIPFFGPFIGAIPSFIIILINSPIQSLYFLIFVLALQQFDGNILGPKILGNSTGLPSFWVLFAILLFGGLFGFIGMLIGVPVFAVLTHIFKDILNRRLRQQHLPTETASYAYLDHIDGDGNPVQHKPKQEQEAQELEEAVLTGGSGKPEDEESEQS